MITQQGAEGICSVWYPRASQIRSYRPRNWFIPSLCMGRMLKHTSRETKQLMIRQIWQSCYHSLADFAHQWPKLLQSRHNHLPNFARATSYLNYNGFYEFTRLGRELHFQNMLFYFSHNAQHTLQNLLLMNRTSTIQISNILIKGVKFHARSMNL